MKNIFVLCTGRCGSVTFARACEHLENYSVGHESRAALVGEERLSYPPRHIEVDNRLSWYLGRLAAAYNDETTLYVHLKRDPEAVAQSHLKRWDAKFAASMIRTFGHGIVMRTDSWPLERRIDVCRDHVATVTANIEEFLRYRRSIPIQLEEAKRDFAVFLDAIKAAGDVDAALAEWDIKHNSTQSSVEAPEPLR